MRQGSNQRAVIRGREGALPIIPQYDHDLGGAPHADYAYAAYHPSLCTAVGYTAYIDIYADGCANVPTDELHLVATYLGCT